MKLIEFRKQEITIWLFGNVKIYYVTLVFTVSTFQSYGNCWGRWFAIKSWEIEISPV